MDNGGTGQVPAGTPTEFDLAAGTVTVPGLPWLDRSRLASPATIRWVVLFPSGKLAVRESPNHTARAITPPGQPDDDLPYQWQLILDVAAVLDPHGRCMAAHGLEWRCNLPGWTVSDRLCLVLHPCRHNDPLTSDPDAPVVAGVDDERYPLNPAATRLLADLLATPATGGMLAHVRGPVVWLGQPRPDGTHTSIPADLLAHLRRATTTIGKDQRS